MAIAEPLLNRASQDEPQSRRWTVAEFERAIAANVFGPEERLELVDGEIYQKMTQNPPHAISLFKSQMLFIQAFGQIYMVRSQLPLSFGAGSGNRPEPDIAIVSGKPEDFIVTHPATALLVIEISDATLTYDRSIKASIYARAGIADYWIVNLPERTLEVHRGPIANAGRGPGFRYQSNTLYTADQAVTPLAFPDFTVRVVDLLP